MRAKIEPNLLIYLVGIRWLKRQTYTTNEMIENKNE